MMIPTRAPAPRAPNTLSMLLTSAVVVAGLAILPQTGHSTPALPRGAYSDLGTPVAQIISLRAPAWDGHAGEYQPLQHREGQLNALLSTVVDILTSGEAVDSRDRLLGLESSLQQTAVELQAARKQLAYTPENPCNSAQMIDRITCHFATTKADQIEAIKDLQGTVSQRQQQILDERDRFASDLVNIGISVRPEQVDTLLHMATANDIVSLHAVYANLQQLNGVLQEAASKTNSSSPANIRRYYGIYTVLLEVAMHMHEEIYFKLRDTYLPKLDALAANAAGAIKQARSMAAATSRVELKRQLATNLASLNTTLHAALLYRQALETQAEAINVSWSRIYEQHKVAVNSFRTASLSASLLTQMQESGRHIATLQQLEIPPIDGLGNAALQREFERLTLQIQLPNT